MFENVDGRTDDGVTGILIAHLGAFGSGELKSKFAGEFKTRAMAETISLSTIPLLQPKLSTSS